MLHKFAISFASIPSFKSLCFFMSLHIVPGPPDGFNAEPTSSTSISASWNVPTVPNGIILRYNLYFSEERNQESKIVVQALPNTKFYIQVVEQRQAFTNYNLSVSAETRIGEGDRSNIVMVRTDPGVSSPPNSVSAKVLNSSAITLSWGYPTNPRGLILGYLIATNATEGEEINTTLASANDMTSQSFTFVSLLPFTYYSFEVAAYSFSAENTILVGTYSDLVIQRTNEDGKVRYSIELFDVHFLYKSIYISSCFL